MTRSTAANIALIVSCLPAVLLVVALGQMGDLPRSNQDDLRASQLIADFAMIGTLATLIG
jgi:hypothetical protein